MEFQVLVVRLGLYHRRSGDAYELILGLVGGVDGFVSVVWTFHRGRWRGGWGV